MSNNHHYNKHLKKFARQHRNDSTKAEIKIWVELQSKKQMLGYSFLRQGQLQITLQTSFVRI